jgi:hypothetical protein
MNKFSALVTVVVTLLFSCRAYAQEALVTLSENPAARPQPERVRLQRSASTSPQAYALSPLSINSLPLPFVDDFVAVQPWPDAGLWTTNGVYVNDHYALNMPTIGVATFDALDAHGRLYPHLSGVAAAADTLASLPIDMSDGSNIVLSFFYQPGGLGDLPGNADILKLEFKAPPDTIWTEVWSAAVNIADSSIIEYRLADLITHKFDTIPRKVDSLPLLHTQFVYTALEIDPSWRQDGFQFRFINDVSLTVNADVPGRANNADFWHLDFVYLDKGRDTADTRLPDVGMVRPQTHITTGYSSIPAHHLPYAASVFPENTTFNIAYRNLGMDIQNVYRRFAIRPLRGTYAPPKEYQGGGENIFDEQLQERTFEFEPYDFSSAINTDAPDVAFEISSCLVFDMGTDALRKALRRNDTTRYIQEFADYYAYDDGSAENGYGLFGYGTSNGRVAVQFKSVMADTLRGVYMYFNMAKDSANLKPFEIAVWDDNGGVPGDTLRREKYSRPALRDSLASRDSLNAYVAYKFDKPLPIARNQVFYVGWIQSSEVFLNIGFDANSKEDATGKNLYALGATGSWYESIYDGALMIRPIFNKSGSIPGKPVLPVRVPGVAAVRDEYFIYPNPATDWITIRDLKAEELGIVSPRLLIEIFDMSGRKHRTGYADGGMFSVSGLAAGMYIVRIAENGTIKASQKIIVN